MDMEQKTTHSVLALAAFSAQLSQPRGGPEQVGHSAQLSSPQATISRQLQERSVAGDSSFRKYWSTFSAPGTAGNAEQRRGPRGPQAEGDGEHLIHKQSVGSHGRSLVMGAGHRSRASVECHVPPHPPEEVSPRMGPGAGAGASLPRRGAGRGRGRSSPQGDPEEEVRRGVRGPEHAGRPGPGEELGLGPESHEEALHSVPPPRREGERKWAWEVGTRAAAVGGGSGQVPGPSCGGPQRGH